MHEVTVPMMPSLDNGSCPQPEWVICGGTMANGKVRLVASRTLNRADLTALLAGEQRERLAVEVALTVTMQTYVLVDADTYEEALRYLFDCWSPTGGRARVNVDAVPTGAVAMVAIGGGS